MDILEFAMQMELDGRDYYQHGAAAAASPQIKQIFETLAEEEHRHYHVFKKLRDGAAASPADLAPAGKTVTTFRNIFRQMVESGAPMLPGDTKRAVWTEARAVEVKSEQMYRDAAAQATDPVKRDMLNRIADEEKNHIYLIDNMIQFLADPQSFAASQDYKSFMSWEGR